MPSQNHVQSYLDSVQIPSYNTKRLFAVGMVGLNGSGKSTFAQALAEKLNLYVASNDHIRRWLNAQGFVGDSPAQELVQEIAEATTRHLYRHHISHIIDNDLIKFYAVARRTAENYGAEFFLIGITAPEELILKRLKQREEEIKNDNTNTLSRVGVSEYLRRKKLHEELRKPTDVLVTVDTSQGIIQEVDKTVDLLRQKNVI